MRAPAGLRVDVCHPDDRAFAAEQAKKRFLDVNIVSEYEQYYEEILNG